MRVLGGDAPPLPPGGTGHIKSKRKRGEPRWRCPSQESLLHPVTRAKDLFCKFAELVFRFPNRIGELLGRNIIIKPASHCHLLLRIEVDAFTPLNVLIAVE